MKNINVIYLKIKARFHHFETHISWSASKLNNIGENKIFENLRFKTKGYVALCSKAYAQRWLVNIGTCNH